jgi:hypothetical protein
MDTQIIIAFALLIISVSFLGWKYIKPVFASKNSDDSCGPDCNCG